MLDQYLKHVYKPQVASDAIVRMKLTKNGMTALSLLCDITVKGATDKAFVKKMTRIGVSVAEAYKNKSLEVPVTWSDFKTLHTSLEKKMANPKIEEPIEGKLAQQELLDSCYETEYQVLKSVPRI